MTPEQISHWRKALATDFGAYAYVMTVEQIESHRDRVQREVDLLDLKVRMYERKSEAEAHREKLTRKGLCKHNVAAKFCKVCK
jgi:hypothetical protein